MDIIYIPRNFFKTIHSDPVNIDAWTWGQTWTVYLSLIDLSLIVKGIVFLRTADKSYIILEKSLMLPPWLSLLLCISVIEF